MDGLCAVAARPRRWLYLPRNAFSNRACLQSPRDLTALPCGQNPPAPSIFLPVQWVVLAAVVLVAVLLALGVRHLIQLADQTAQAKWGMQQQQQQEL